MSFQPRYMVNYNSTYNTGYNIEMAMEADRTNATETERRNSTGSETEQRNSWRLSSDKKQKLEKQLGSVMSSLGRLLQHPRHLEVSWMEQQERQKRIRNSRSNSPWSNYSGSSGQWSDGGRDSDASSLGSWNDGGNWAPHNISSFSSVASSHSHPMHQLFLIPFIINCLIISLLIYALYSLMSVLSANFVSVQMC